MTNPQHREMMSELYRLWEKYENPPKVIYTEDSVEFWNKVCNDTTLLYNKYHDDPVAKELLIAFYSGLCEYWKVINPNPTIDKPPEPEQLSVF